MENLDLRAVAQAASTGYQTTSDVVELTVAGQPSVTYDLFDDSAEPALHMRPLIMTLPDGRLVLLVFGTRDAAWERFRPAVSAIISSIELASSNPAAMAPGEGTAQVLVSRASALMPDRRQQEDTPNQFIWEDYGIQATLPEGWVSAIGDGQDYDMALVSPEAMQGNLGAFITLKGFPGLALGGSTFESALQPIVDELKIESAPFTIAGLEGIAINRTDEAAGVQQRFILLPYGTRGDALYINSTAPLGSDEVILGILDSLTITPPQPDFAAVDAAWQTSLDEQGKLIVGDPDAPIKMREYLSFTCGHCVHYSRSVERLIALDVESGRVQYEFAPLAWDTFAHDAALATYCAAEQGKGYSASEILFQGYMEQGVEVAYSRDGINALLSPLGLDMDALNACIDNGRYENHLNAASLDFHDQGLTGTPTIALGVGDDPIQAMILPDGQVWSGAIPLQFLRDIFKAVLEEGITIQEYFQ
jgi:protein-disulfide isomerase